MFKKVIKYVDYDGNEREESFYFHLNQSELATMEMSVKGGLKKYLERAIEDKDGPKVFDVFKQLVDKSYGIKSNDGREFHKSPEILRSFTETEAYNILFMEIVTDEKAAMTFFESVAPKTENSAKPALLNAYNISSGI